MKKRFVAPEYKVRMVSYTNIIATSPGLNNSARSGERLGRGTDWEDDF